MAVEEEKVVKDKVFEKSLSEKIDFEEKVKERGEDFEDDEEVREVGKRRGRKRKEELSQITGKTIGERLRLFLMWEGLTAKEVAERSGLSESTILNYMNNPERSPIAEKLAEIAKAIPINLHWLLTGEGDPYYRGESARGESGGREFDVESEERVLETPDENEFILYCMRRVLREPLERRYLCLLELIGKRHGLSFLFSPQFVETQGKRPEKVLETVRDILDAYEEIVDFIEKIKKKLPI